MKIFFSGRNQGNSIRYSKGDRFFYALIDILLVLCLVIVLYPIIHVVSASFSSGAAVAAGRVKLLPVEPTLAGYEEVLGYRDIWSGYKNSLIYTTVGTVINLFCTILAAYPLSRKDLKGRKWMTFLITFTMIFNGGIIPNYILMQRLHLLDTMWALVLPNAIIVSNFVICKNHFENNLSSELLEAAKIDGCSDINYLVKIALPLSKSIVAVLLLYYAVYHWNSFFDAMIYLRDDSKYPLQLILREILVLNEVSMDIMSDPEMLAKLEQSRELVKYAVIVVSSLPVLIIYPFVQKYFVSGRMAGAVKG